MTKKAAGRLVFAVILLAVLSIIAFSTPSLRTKKFWFAYVCGILAVLYQIYVFKVSLCEKNTGNRCCGFPVTRLGTYYLVFQVTASILQLSMIQCISGWAMAAVNIPFLSFPIIGIITTQTIRAETARKNPEPRKK